MNKELTPLNRDDNWSIARRLFASCYYITSSVDVCGYGHRISSQSSLMRTSDRIVETLGREHQLTLCSKLFKS